MTPFDNVGRIHKEAFIVSNLVLYGLCLTSACARYYIRFFVQGQFALDDGILLFGIACLTTAMVLLFKFIDKMYLVGASEAGAQGVVYPVDFAEEAFDFGKFATAALILTWCSIASVKFSYLFIFRKLIDRVRPMLVYWWVAVVYNVLICMYGASVYVASCPYYYSFKALECIVGAGLKRALALAISQMILDIIGDLLILFIPFRLIWRVKIRLGQKLALACTLCLTILTILCTIVRMAGIHTGRTVPSIDSVWETYWQFIAANIAVTMTTATAFRSFFVSRSNDGAPHTPPMGGLPWYSKSRRFLLLALSPQSWRSKNLPRSSGDDSNWQEQPAELPQIHQRATLTGVRTYINHAGRTRANNSRIMDSVLSEEGEGDCWPLSPTGRFWPGIMVQQDISMKAEHV